jgi:hypothetical protein
MWLLAFMLFGLVQAHHDQQLLDSADGVALARRGFARLMATHAAG